MKTLQQIDNIWRKSENLYFKGQSYKKRVKDINAIYDQHVKTGLSNRQIWELFVYPIYGITERTFYNYLKKDYGE